MVVNRVDPITLIVTAQATAGLKGDLQDKLAAARKTLNSLLRKRLADDAAGQVILDEYEDDPETWRVPLERKLASVGAADDPRLLSAAATVLDLVDAKGAASGKYNVTVSHGQGVQIGSYNTQANFFRSPPSREDTTP